MVRQESSKKQRKSLAGDAGIGLASATSFSHSNAILFLNNLGVGS